MIEAYFYQITEPRSAHATAMLTAAVREQAAKTDLEHTYFDEYKLG